MKILVDNNPAVNVYITTYRMNIVLLSEGEHQLAVELVKNDGSSFNPIVKRVLHFSVLRSALKSSNQPKQAKIVHPARLFYGGRI